MVQVSDASSIVSILSCLRRILAKRTKPAVVGPSLVFFASVKYSLRFSDGIDVAINCHREESDQETPSGNFPILASCEDWVSFGLPAVTFLSNSSPNLISAVHFNSPALCCSSTE